MVYGLSKNYYCISLIDINIIRYIQDYIYTPKIICICSNNIKWKNCGLIISNYNVYNFKAVKENVKGF
jgi:hypothetical protein